MFNVTDYLLYMLPDQRYTFSSQEDMWWNEVVYALRKVWTFRILQMHYVG